MNYCKHKDNPDILECIGLAEGYWIVTPLSNKKLPWPGCSFEEFKAEAFTSELYSCICGLIKNYYGGTLNKSREFGIIRDSSIIFLSDFESLLISLTEELK